MANRHDFNHQVWRAAILTVGLAACLVFGIIVAASTIGLAREIPVIRNLCGTGNPGKGGAG